MAFLFATVSLDILGLGIIIPIAPGLVRDLSGGDAAAGALSYGLLAATFGLMQFLFVPLLGSLSDRYGRRPVLLLSLSMLCLDYLLHALAPTVTLLFFCRALAGAAAGTYAVVNAYIADISRPEERAAKFGLIGSAFTVGFIVGPALGGLLGQVNLRLPFYVAAGLVFVNILFGLFVLPESHPSDRRQPVRWKLANPVGAFLWLVRRPSTRYMVWAVLLMAIAAQAFQQTWVLYLMTRFDWQVGNVGLFMAAGGVLTALVQWRLVGPITSALGERRSVVLGLAAMVAANIGYALAASAWMLVPAVVLGSLGSITAPALQGALSRRIPDADQGMAQGGIMSTQSLAELAIPVAATGLFAYFVSTQAPVYVPGVTLYVAAALLGGALLLLRNRKAFQEPAPAEPTPAVVAVG